MGYGFSHFLALLLWVGAAWLAARIASRAGYPAATGLFAVIPVINVIVFLVFAIQRWPITVELESAKKEVNYLRDARDEDRLTINKLRKELVELQARSSEQTQADLRRDDFEKIAYAKVADELASDYKEQGLWLRAEVVAQGDPARQRREYILMRVDALSRSEKT